MSVSHYIVHGLAGLSKAWRHRERQPSEPIEFCDNADRFPIRYHQMRIPKYLTADSYFI